MEWWFASLWSPVTVSVCPGLLTDWALGYAVLKYLLLTLGLHVIVICTCICRGCFILFYLLVYEINPILASITIALANPKHHLPFLVKLPVVLSLQVAHVRRHIHKCSSFP